MRFATLVYRELNKKTPDEKEQAKYNLYGLVLKGDKNTIDKMVETLLVIDTLGNDFDKIQFSIDINISGEMYYLAYIGVASDKLVKAVCGETMLPVYIVPKHLLSDYVRAY